MISSAFDIDKYRSICIIGCAGKTSLMYALARENKQKKVLVSTTTHIRIPGAGQIEEHMTLLARPSSQLGKLKGVEPEELWQESEKHQLVLIEGDGSKCLPLKGWADHEPIVPEWVDMTIGVCTLWPTGQEISEEIVFRLDEFEKQTGAVKGEKICLEHIAAMCEEMFRKAVGRKMLFINQVEDEAARSLAREFALNNRLTDIDIIMGSIKEDWAEKLN